MRFVIDRVLPHQVADLEARLEAVLPKFPARRREPLQRMLHRPLQSRRLGALHAFANLAEAEGWLDAAEVLAIRKLAYRIAFYLRRGEQERRPRASDTS
jgi:hypothetical protein